MTLLALRTSTFFTLVLIPTLYVNDRHPFAF